MRLASFIIGDHRTWGVVARDETLVAAAQIKGLPGTLADHIETQEAAAIEALNSASEDGRGVPPDDVIWLPPIPRPGKIIGVAINNTMGQRAAVRPFANPAFFFKPSSCLTGHEQPVIIRESFGITHPEPELAVVVGRGGRGIPEADATKHIFGYSILNDITSPGLKSGDSIEIVSPTDRPANAYRELLGWRNVRDDDHARSTYLTYHARSKGTDTFGPVGPWITTADEVADPNDLAIRSFDGDTPVFEDSTANLAFSVEQILSHASQFMTLEAGDIIHCGTAMRPAANSPYSGLTNWNLQSVSGRPMRVDIEGIGTLRNPVRVEQ
ncbi:MAG: fumarylacetoacetate hydrolase family protein [Ilumatobacteraceae bacterium]